MKDASKAENRVGRRLNDVLLGISSMVSEYLSRSEEFSVDYIKFIIILAI